MIIPVAFEVSRRQELEDFVLAKTREIVVAPPPPDARVTVKLFDTETRQGCGFSARLLVDHEVSSPYHNLLTMFRFGTVLPVEGRDYLVTLRDAINAELGEST